MPSIAGIAIILWISTVAGDEFRALILIPRDVSDLNTLNLILLFLYANLFCYVASYPILGFHATRVLDFDNNLWPSKWWSDGYIWSLILGVLSFAVALNAGSNISFIAAYVLVSAYVFGQLIRIFYGLRNRRKYSGLKEKASPVYAYAYSLARRRSMVEEVTQTQSQNDKSDSNSEKGTERTRTNRWRPEFMDTYRHMREHGNSAYIFFLELSLAALVYAVVSPPGKSALYQLSAIGVLFAVWALPAVVVHLLGQDLERRFSQYERRIDGNGS
jgi:hypothetical protein